MDGAINGIELSGSEVMVMTGFGEACTRSEEQSQKDC